MALATCVPAQGGVEYVEPLISPRGNAFRSGSVTTARELRRSFDFPTDRWRVSSLQVGLKTAASSFDDHDEQLMLASAFIARREPRGDWPTAGERICYLGRSTRQDARATAAAALRRLTRRQYCLVRRRLMPTIPRGGAGRSCGRRGGRRGGAAGEEAARASAAYA